MDSSGLDLHLIYMSHPPNVISIGLAVLVQHVRVTSTQTHSPRYVRHLQQ